MSDTLLDTTTTIPVVMTPSGAVPTDPSTIRTNLTNIVASTNPGYTSNLPGSLIEDIASTDVAALALVDQAYVDLVNSVTPYGANLFLLNQLGQIYGVKRGIAANTSVYVTFTGTAGFVIPVGFTVSDGSYQYTVQDGGIVNASGTSAALYCLATVSGSWAIPINTVTQIITSLPSGITLTCTNLTAGLPGESEQSDASYRAQVIQAGLATCQGAPSFIKTKLLEVSGVQENLVSVVNVATNQWEIIVGGGDPYQVADAIYRSVPDISALVGSTLKADAITNANPGVVTTNLNHGYSTGQVINIAGASPSGFNGNFTITVLTEKTFSLGVNTTGFGSYSGGGVITPNLRNVTVSVNDYPNTYGIKFVVPPVQTVTLSVVWNTISTNLVSNAAVAQLGTPALIAYINSIYVGQPINTFELQDTFQNAIASIIPMGLISKLQFSVAINGIATSPAAGSLLIYGDPESYFTTNSGLITVAQG